MKLSQLETQSAVWSKIRRELEERLQAMRERNDGALTVEETATLRGSIKMCKEILGWAEPTPQID